MFSEMHLPLIFAGYYGRGDDMAKKGMRRPDPSEPHGTESNSITHFPKNPFPPVPEIQGQAKRGHKKANPPPAPQP